MVFKSPTPTYFSLKTESSQLVFLEMDLLLSLSVMTPPSSSQAEGMGTTFRPFTPSTSSLHTRELLCCKIVDWML